MIGNKTRLTIAENTLETIKTMGSKTAVDEYLVIAIEQLIDVLKNEKS